MALGACVVNDGGDVLVKGHRLCPTQLNKTGHEGRKKKNEVPHSSNVCKPTVFFPELHLMTKPIHGLVLLIAFSAASGTFSAQSHDVAAPDERGFVVKVGDDMPSFELTDLTGEVHSRQSLLGKVYVLQFTASWCSVCRAEMPHLEREVWEAYQDGGTGFMLLGVDYDESAEKIATFAASTGVTYPMCPDPKGNVFSLIAAPKSGVTRNVVVDKSGRIAMLTRLFDAEEFALMVQRLKVLTKQP